jgi:hypothetical protein
MRIHLVSGAGLAISSGLRGKYIRRPTGSAFGQNRFASPSSMMMTGGGRGRHVAVGEQSTADERHAQRLQVPGRHV